MTTHSVLIIDDDAELRSLLEKHLREINCDVDSVGTGSDGLSNILKKNYDLILLDLALPDMNGLDICRLLKREGRRELIFMLTARSSEVDRVVGLELGADDYLTKPFSYREVQARIKALFRRAEKNESSSASSSIPIVRGPMIIDGCRRTLAVHGKTIDLTAKEFDLLYYLVEHPGHVFSRSKLLNAVWGSSYAGYEHTVNSHVNRLRAKIEADPAHPEFVHTVRGAGYKFCENDD